MRRLLLAPLALVIASAAVMTPVQADVVDPASEPVSVIAPLVDALDAAEVDVLYSHESEKGRSGPSFADRPRVAPLLGFKAWPGIEVDLERHGEWLDAFATGVRGAVAAAPVADDGETRPDREAFRRIWRDAGESERVIITFDAADLDIAEKIAGVLEANGYAVYLAIASPEVERLDPESLGRLFVEAGHRLTIDTPSARLNAIIQFEAELLAELARQDAWVASGEGLPPIKRGSMDVVESLGVLPMKVLPGGIVLGKRLTLDPSLSSGPAPPSVTLAIEGSDYGVQVGDDRYVMEQVSQETREAIIAFITIPDSHSVVDIAGGNVTLAAPFRDTRIGERMTRADKQPFDHLSVNGARKSLIVDDAIVLRRHGDRIAVDVSLEVRFYQTDDEGHADRLASLRFTVEDATGSPRLLDLTWKRRPRSKIDFDGRGAEELTGRLKQLAVDAALIAMARL